MDFSKPSVVAADWVIRHIAPTSEVVLVHAIPIPTPSSFLRELYPADDAMMAEARRHGETLFRELDRSLWSDRVRTEIRVGRPEDVLVAAARDLGAALLVTAMHGERGLWRVLGSTGERLVRTAPVSVLLSRGLSDHHPPRTILLALDESDLLSAIIAWTSYVVDTANATVVVMHVGPAIIQGADFDARPSPSEAELERKIRDWLRQQIANTGFSQAAIDVTFGDPGFEIDAAAERLAADLVILGRRGRAQTDMGFVGTTAEFMIRNSARPLLVVTGPPDAG